jgi:hypothetical protein
VPVVDVGQADVCRADDPAVDRGDEPLHPRFRIGLPEGGQERLPQRWRVVRTVDGVQGARMLPA